MMTDDIVNINDIKAGRKELESWCLFVDGCQQGWGSWDPIKTVMKSEKDGNHNTTSCRRIFSPTTEIEDFVNFSKYWTVETGTCPAAMRRRKRSLKTKKSPKHSSLIIWRMLESWWLSPYCQRLLSSFSRYLHFLLLWCRQIPLHWGKVSLYVMTGNFQTSFCCCLLDLKLNLLSNH